METAFSIKAGEFEGPLDLLLDLIEERKMLVSDISLSQVSDDFLAYLQSHVAFPVGQAAHFVVVAATLLLIKSRSLLPVLSLTDEEEGDVKDLEFRLALYQIIRNAAKRFAGSTEHMFFGPGARVSDPIFTPSDDVSLASIREAASRVLANAPKESAPREEVTVREVVSLEEMMERLSARIEKAIHMTFRDFSTAEQAGGKLEIVVSFLAMLELVKRGLLNVDQHVSFGEITMGYNGELKAPRLD